tara:strand:+ start:440 stop:1279 length:840 start_codon:yes stop_codon:yes gene_type:complete
MKNKNINEEIKRIKSLFTEERLYGNLCEQEFNLDNFLNPKNDPNFKDAVVDRYSDLNIEPKNTLPNFTQNIKNKGDDINTDDKEKKDTKTLSSNLIVDINTKILSNQGASKDYDDLFVDTNGYTAVGILHFTKGGLANLYNVMDTEKYFSKTNKEMIDTINVYKGKEYYDEQWKKNILKFLNSDDTKKVQNKAIVGYHKGKIENITKGKPHTPREYAIIMSISNSSPSLLRKLNKKYDGNYEKMIGDYCSKKCRTRCKILNNHYPNTNQDKDFVYKGCV